MRIDDDSFRLVSRKTIPIDVNYRILIEVLFVVGRFGDFETSEKFVGFLRAVIIGIRHLSRYRLAETSRSGNANIFALGVDSFVQEVQQVRFVNEVGVSDAPEIVIAVVYKFAHDEIRFYDFGQR